MFRPRNRAVGAALLMVVILILTACSATGGKRAAEQAQIVAAGHASTPHYTVAMITHAGPGQSFWDIERNGGLAAAAKDNLTLRYSADPDPTKQATLIQDAINSHVNAIAVTDPNPGALCPTIGKAKAAGIPVAMFNAGSGNWQQCGAMEYFGQDETIAGVAAGKLYVNGQSPPDELSTMTAALTKDKSVDAVITLDAQVALIALQAMQQAHSTAKLSTFDTNSPSIAKIKSGAIQWAVDQQPYLQGYEAVDSLWLYLTNGNILGGGQAVLTGPSFIDAANVATVAQYAARGTR